MVNVAVLEPAATVTVEGTVAALLLLERSMALPPLGAATLSVTVPVEETPPLTEAGATDSEANSGWIVRVAVLLAPLSVAVMVAVVLAVTAVVLTVKVAVFAPADTLTV